MDTIRAMGNILFSPKQSTQGTIPILGDKAILNIGTNCNTLFRGKHGMKLPRIVVAGAQSAGKSTLFNNMTKLNILSTGSGEAVTRVPAIINMVNVADSICTIEFYDHDGNVINTFKVDPYNPDPDIEEKIREYIEVLTVQYAGPGKNIKDIPINIKMFSPLVPDLELVDLPGLTTYALTGKGQPKDICQQIERMVTKYIMDEKCIVMAVIPSTREPEVDAGFALVKKLKKDDVIGVITKADMASRGNNPSKYVDGDIVPDLHLKYGYFAVKNDMLSDPKDKKDVVDDILDESFDQVEMNEKNFFANNSHFRNTINRDRLGTENLGKKLSEILIGRIRDDLPRIFEKLRKLEDETNKELEGLGMDYPVDKEGKRMLINVLLNDFQDNFLKSIRGRGSTYNTGNLLAKNYSEFKTQVSELTPFDTDNLSDDTIRDITSSYEGVHMPSPATPIEVLELCISGKYTMDDGPLEPIELIKTPFIKCMTHTQKILLELIESILSEDRFSRFPCLVTKIKTIIVNSILPIEYNRVINMVNDHLESHRDYVWTDDKKFREILNKNEQPQNSLKSIRNILLGYYNVTKSQISETVHRYIQVFYVHKVISEMSKVLHFNVRDGSSEDDLLKENDEKKKKRDELVKLKEKIEKFKTTAMKLSTGM